MDVETARLIITGLMAFGLLAVGFLAGYIWAQVEKGRARYEAMQHRHDKLRRKVERDLHGEEL